MINKIILIILCILPFGISAQIITTIAGNGILGYSGNGGQATDAEVFPCAVILDNSGNYYISEGSNNVVCKVNASGIITNIAGNGTPSYSGDGGMATDAAFNLPSGIAIDQYGNLFIADFGNNRVRKVSVSGIVTTVVGTGTGGYSGDGGPATAAMINNPSDLCFDKYGNLYISEGGCQGIRKVSTTYIISTFAGTGAAGYSGDGGPATDAVFHGPKGLVIDESGNLYVADNENYRVRKISSSGIVKTVAGNGFSGSSGNNGPATAASICVYGIAIDKFNNILISDNCNMVVHQVDEYGIIRVIVGNGIQGFSGDGGPATASEMFHPYFFSLDSCGGIYIPDADNHRVRKVTYPKCDYLSVKELSTTTELSFSPNPVINDLHINNLSQTTTYQLHNIIGTTVAHGILNAGNNTLSLHELPPGLYMLEIVGEDGVREVRKVVKE